MLKNSYHPNDSRVIAHNNVVQQIQTGGMEIRGLHFEAEEDAMTMIVQLGVVCTCNVRVTEDLKKWAKLCTVAKHIFSNSIRSTLAK
jgi:hypothetical protein